MSKTRLYAPGSYTCTFAAWAVIFLTGCETARKAVESPRELRTRDFFMDLDVTGLREEIEARTELWNTYKDRVKEVDVEGFNQAVAELNALLQKLSGQVDDVPSDDLRVISQDLVAAAAAIRAKAESLDVERAVSSIEDLSVTLKTKTEELDTRSVEDVLVESRSLVVQVQDMLSQWDCQVRAGLEDARAVIAHTDERIQSLPFSEFRDALVGVQGSIAGLRESAGNFPATGRSLGNTLVAVRWAAYAAIVVLALVGLRILIAVLRGRKHSG